MLAGILIIAFSLALLVYWFRYSCILILRNQQTGALPMADNADGRFSCATVRQSVKSASDLDPLEAALERDYRVLTYLIEHAAGLKLASLEDRLLMIDYRMMQRVYRFTKRLAPTHSRAALTEMADVLGILVQRMGQQSGIAAQA
jgi:hypothetical protein